MDLEHADHSSVIVVGSAREKIGAKPPLSCDLRCFYQVADSGPAKKDGSKQHCKHDPQRGATHPHRIARTPILQPKIRWVICMRDAPNKLH